jgi:thiamine kinase-like enzyme
MMEAYRGDTASAALYSRLEIYKAIGDLHWSVWGFVQHAKGNPTEDFWSYGLERLRRSEARMSSADFTHHLGVVRTSGVQPHGPYSDAPALHSPNYVAEI